MDRGAVVGQFAGLADEIRERPARLGTVRWVCVDGPAGSGKTTFANRLVAALRARGASVAEVHTDDLLEGWTDLESFWPRLADQILEPLALGTPTQYRRYDWVRGSFAEEPVALAVPDVLVLEGVSSARTAGDAWRGLGVYVHADRAIRLARGIARDGEALRPQWLRWMADEDRHFVAERTRERADVRVDGAPSLPHDANDEYIQLAHLE